MKKILVTGAGGFIGSHLTERLVAEGNDVTAFVHYNSFGTWGWLDYASTQIKSSVEVFAGDVRDSYGVRKAMKGCSTVYHLAALIGIPYSYHSPESYIDTNVKGTLNVVQAARDLDVEKVVHTSTSEVYGTAGFVPISETHPLKGQSPYSASKIGADQIALSFYNSFETPVCVIRPFNTYGPRQSLRAVIPTLITQALSQRSISIGDLTPTRDFTFVSDTVDAFQKIAKIPESSGAVVNVGSNYEIAIGDLAKMIINLTGNNVELREDPQRFRPPKSEVQRLWCDNTLAKKLLGWEPMVLLEQGILQSIEWYASRLNSYETKRYCI